MNTLIVGSPLLRDALAQRCIAAGYPAMVLSSREFVETRRPANHWDGITFCIEAETSSLELKKRVLAALPGAGTTMVCALNMSVAEAASLCPLPELVTGYAFLPPFPEGEGLVEIAAGPKAPASGLVWSTLGLRAAEVADNPGLVRARTLCCLINEACSAFADRIAGEEDIDRAMQLGVSYPQGLLAWGRALGWDTVLGVMTALHTWYGDDRYRPSPELRRRALAM